MRIGTRSLLFGCHQFLIHPLFVLLGWIWLYGVRSLSPGLLLAIVIHDWGYWGAPDLDGVEGSNHPVRAAQMIRRMTKRGDLADMVLLHSRSLSRRLSREPSRLCWADKWGTVIMPSLLWAVLAWLSGEGAEYMRDKNSGIYQAGDKPTIPGLIKFHRRVRLFITAGHRMVVCSV